LREPDQPVRLRGAAFVAMMEAADLWDRDGAPVTTLKLPGLLCVPLGRKRPGDENSLELAAGRPGKHARCDDDDTVRRDAVSLQSRANAVGDWCVFRRILGAFGDDANQFGVEIFTMEPDCRDASRAHTRHAADNLLEE
jgi:hypothetical protein